MHRRKFVTQLAGLGALSVWAPGRIFGKTIEGDLYQVKQFKDEGLAHFSYAVLAGGKIIVVDPARDAKPYHEFAQQNQAKITGVIETHPHADFASSHLELHQATGATIYASSLTNPHYPFTAYDDGNIVKLTNEVSLRSLFTPGHAPDHVSAVLVVNGKDVAVFSGDSLLIGDVGRPDLRGEGDPQTQRKHLASAMYHTIHQKFAKLNDDVIVYPAHGAGSLCGKAMRNVPSSTIGYERANNYAFARRTEDEFVALLLSDLPFIPQYFLYDVQLNIKGVPDEAKTKNQIQALPTNYQPEPDALVIDGRPENIFKQSFVSGAVNIQLGSKFETWLGSVVPPQQSFYLVAANQEAVDQLVNKAAKIGYDQFIKGTFVYDRTDGSHLQAFDASNFNPASGQYTIIDVRTPKEFHDEPIFNGAINIPLSDLAERVKDIPTDKPVLVTCASGYRSAAGTSIVKKYRPDAPVYDLGKAVNNYIGKSKAQ